MIGIVRIRFRRPSLLSSWPNCYPLSGIWWRALSHSNRHLPEHKQFPGLRVVFTIRGLPPTTWRAASVTFYERALTSRRQRPRAHRLPVYPEITGIINIFFQFQPTRNINAALAESLRMSRRCLSSCRPSSRLRPMLIFDASEVCRRVRSRCRLSALRTKRYMTTQQAL